MAKKRTPASKPAGGNEVEAFVVALEHPRKAEIEALRVLILGADRRIQESIKWNAPSFYLRDHFATLRLQPRDTLQVVLHTGAKARSNSSAMDITDPAGLLKWAAKDRCVVTFTSLKDIHSKQDAFVAILKQWVEQL